METYFILEDNMPRLQKKLKRIESKCIQYGCSFEFKEIGEEVRSIKDDASGVVRLAKYIKVQAEGVAKIPNWEFVAQIDHRESGNIIRQTNYDVDISSEYYSCKPTCEHCNKIRSRKNTCIVRNTETGELKQVGNTCLVDYTCGFDAAFVAQYISWFDTLIQGEIPYTGISFTPYYNTEELLRISAEVYRKFGYANRDSDYPTSVRVKEYYKVLSGETIVSRSVTESIKADMTEVEFNENSEEVIQLVNDVSAWLESCDESNTYIHNLKMVCLSKYIQFKDIGILASVFLAYDREMGRLKKIADRKEKFQNEGARSQYQGAIGERITVDVDLVVVTSWNTIYGCTYLYKLLDAEGNVYIWKSANYIEKGRYTVTGTIKAHNDYNEVKQTELTRCRTKKIVIDNDDNTSDDSDITQVLDEVFN